MADSGLSVIQQALEKDKVYAPGVAINAADIARGLSLLNQMQESWSNEHLACFANLEQSFPLQVGVGSYTIGTGGVINKARPLEILPGPGHAYLVDVNANRFGMDVVTQEQWNQIGLLNQSSQLPTTLFYDPQYPLGIINIFPLPLIAYTVYFDSRLALVDLPTVQTNFSLPPGYITAIVDNLAIKLWPYYKQGDPPNWMIEEARLSLATIKRTNIKMTPSQYDSAIVSKASSSYNIFSDSNNRGNG